MNECVLYITDYTVSSIGERQLLFYRRHLCSDNIVLRTFAKYDIKSIYFFTATVKNAVR